MDVKQSLLEQLDQLRKATASVRKTLRMVEQQELQESMKAMRRTHRFFSVRPIVAARTLLREAGGKMPIDELTTALMEGGVSLGTKRGHHNVRVSLQIAIKQGTLLLLDNDVVSLPPGSKDKLSAA